MYIIFTMQDTELGTEVTTITTTDGENVQVVIKSVERRGHHEAAPSTITANTASSADLTPNVQTVTTSDGTCTNVVRTHHNLSASRRNDVLSTIGFRFQDRDTSCPKHCQPLFKFFLL